MKIQKETEKELLSKITIKSKKETEKELKHEDVYVNDIYIGYLIKDNTLVGNILEWHFVSKSEFFPHILKKTRKELLIELNNRTNILIIKHKLKNEQN